MLFKSKAKKGVEQTVISGYVKAIRWGHNFIMLFLEEKFTEEELAFFK